MEERIAILYSYVVSYCKNILDTMKEINPSFSLHEFADKDGHNPR